MATTGRLLLPHEIYERFAPAAAAALFVFAPHEHFRRPPGSRHHTTASQAARRQHRTHQRQLDYPVRAGYAPAAAGHHATPQRQSRILRQFVMPTVPEGYAPAAVVPRSNDVDVDAGVPAVPQEVPWYSNGRFGSVPESGEAIAALVETTAGEVREKDCSVCLEVFEEGDKLRMMPWNHAFRESCISEWLLVNHLCQLCRFALPTEAEEEQARLRPSSTAGSGI